jgi:hypothetical protein
MENEIVGRKWTEMGGSKDPMERGLAGICGEDAGIEQVCVRVLPDGRMSRDDAARYLGRTSKTLAMWHAQRKGPRSVLVGGRRFYFKSDLDAFIGSAGEAA